MKVMHVVLSLDCGGLEKLVVDLVNGLNKKGIESMVLCLGDKGVLSKQIEEKGIEVVSLEKKDGLDFGLFFQLAKILKSAKIDIVHTHNLGPLVYGSVAAKLAGCKALNTRHGRTDKKISSLVWNLNDYIVPVSEDTKTHLLHCNRMNKLKVKVIYNGIDIDVFNQGMGLEEKSKIREDLGLKKESFIIGHVGRLSAEKDQLTLLKAFRNIVYKEHNAELIIIGDGDQRETLKKAAKEFKIDASVKFLGHRDDVSKILRVMDVFVLTSFREGLSLAILEAMACGVPIVATKIGGTPEVIVDGENGYLAPCGFPERIENGIMRIFSNKELHQKMSANCLKLAKDNFSLDRMTADYEELYRKMLNK